MPKREKQPKPWEVETQTVPPLPPELLPLEGEQPDYASSSPLAGSEDPADSGLLETDVMVRPKKKRNPKVIVVIILALIVAGLLVFRFVWSTLKGPDPTYAEFQTVERGTLQQTLTANGVIRTADKRTIFSPATAPINNVNFSLGEVVTAGSQIFSFDTTELQRSVSTAQASQNLGALQAQQARSGSAEAQQNVSDYQSGINNMQQQRDIAKNRLAEAQASLANVNASVTPVLAAKKAELESLRNQQTSLLTSDSAAAAALQPQIDALAAEVATMEGQLSGAATAVSAAQADVEYHNGLISQLESLRDQNDKAVLDQNGQAQLNAQGVPTQNTLATAKDQLAAAQAGIQAPITGVVTALQTEQGALASQYSPLCVIESLDKVDVLLSLSRYDLERVKVGQSATISTMGQTYTGTVTHIDQMATAQTTQSGTTNYVSATVSIQNPDQNITLGIDAKVEIATGKAEDVLMVPINAVNTDVEGSYVFVNENGIAHRRSVETGLSSDSEMEIVSGLSAGETVLLASQNITEGMKVSDDPAYMRNQDLMSMMM